MLPSFSLSPDSLVLQSLRRWLCVTVLVSISSVAMPLCAGEIELPDIGLSASAAITEDQEAAYGAELLRLLRNYNLLIEDPIITEYLATLSNRLVSSSRKPEQPFRFVVLNEPSINAFAVPGGLIAAHTGLILAASQESEFASVLAHEIAHVTQKHVVRAQERQRLAAIPLMIASLAAAVAASQSSSSGDAVPAAIVSGQALMQQLSINFTRDNEYEADRIGIQTLSKAGFDVYAMPRMFGLLQRNFHIAPEEAPPEYLRTHPLSLTRISEAEDRARALAKPTADTNSTAYVLIRERLRVLSGSNLTDTRKRYQRLMTKESRSLATVYGYYLTLLRSGDYDEARTQLRVLNEQLGNDLIIKLAAAELAVAEKDETTWRKAYSRLETLYPRHNVITAMHVDALMGLGTAKAGDDAREVLRRLIVGGTDDPEVYERLGRANEIAGSKVAAGEAHARAAVLRGAYESALLQLQELARRVDLDFYARARVDAQIAELTPIVIELRERFGRPSTR